MGRFRIPTEQSCYLAIRLNNLPLILQICGIFSSMTVQPVSHRGARMRRLLINPGGVARFHVLFSLFLFSPQK